VSHFVCPAAQGRSWGLDLHEESWELLGCPMGAACRSKQACACVGMILSKVNDVEICLLAHHGVVTLTEVDAAMQMSHCVRLHFRFPSEEVDPPPEPRLPHNTATDWARTLYPLESPPIPYDCDSRKKLLDSNQNVVQCRRVECGRNVQGQKWPTYVRFGPFWVRSSLTERPFGRAPPPKPAPERGANASLRSPLLRGGLTPPCRAPPANHRFPNGFSTFSRGTTFSMGHFFFSAIHSSLFSFLAHLTFQCGLQ
jgi:hypothetical protein